MDDSQHEHHRTTRLLMNEARFLESQKARLEARNKSSRRQRAQELAVLSSALQSKLASWTHKLQALQGSSEHLSLELSSLQSELRELKKHCISGGHSTLLPTVPDHVPLADLQRWHQTFADCQKQLDRVRDELLPESRFVFERYRKALREHLANPDEPQESTTSAQTAPATGGVVVQLENEEDTLRGYRNANLVLGSDGTVQITRGSITETFDRPQLAVLQEFYDCQITVYVLVSIAARLLPCRVSRFDSDRPLTSLHLVSLYDCTLQFVQPLGSALHVTQCHRTKLQAPKVQQLRLHESSALECVVNVTAGAILEDCTEIVFRGSVEVKDFNWLRDGIPSPNYRVVENPVSTVPRVLERPAVVLPAMNPPLDESNDDSDDDEL